MRSSSSNNVRSFVITPATTVSELLQALPGDNSKVYASKMSKKGVSTLYFAPHKNAEASRVHFAVSVLIGTGSPEKRMAFHKIKTQVTKDLTTDFLIGILDEVQQSLPKATRSESISTFSSFSDDHETQSEEVSTSISSFSQVSLSEEPEKEKKPKS